MTAAAVTVPGGEFAYGSTPAELDWLLDTFTGLLPSWFAAEHPRCTRTTDEFAIGVHPVTNGEYAAFVADDGYRRPELWKADGRDWLGRCGRDRPKFWIDPRWHEWVAADRPVVGVTWYEADAYTRWSGARLPTEAEWEKAARGTDARRFPWGERFDVAKANTAEAHVGRELRDVAEWRRLVGEGRPWRANCLTTRVGDHPAGQSPYGVHDLSGNVWEWCADRVGASRVLRGGSFGYMAWTARTTERGMHPPWWCALGIGFRRVIGDRTAA